jgi:hypothetical protein
MRPTALRLACALAAAVAALSLAATTVTAAGDLAACSLVASEGTDPDPLGTILEAVTVADDGDVWAVGSHVVGPISSPYAQRWDGDGWTKQQLDLPEGPIGISSLYDVEAFGPDDVWAVGSWMGEDPLVQHWDGTRWQAVAVPELAGTEGILTGVDGTGPQDVWISGQRRADGQEHAVVLHGGLGGFQIVPPPDAAVLHDVAIGADGTPVVAGWRIDEASGFAQAVIAARVGDTWRTEPTPVQEGRNVFVFGLAVQGGSMWAVGFSNASPDGDTPVTYRRGPDGWTELPAPDLGPSTRLVSVASDRSGTVAVGVVSEGGSVRSVAIRSDGDAWSSVPGAGSQPPDALGGVAVDDGQIWAVGRAVVVGATYGVPAARVYSCG